MEKQANEELEIFDYIQSAVSILDAERDAFNRSASKICAYLENEFKEQDEIVGVTYRIKSSASLKEKIIRNSLYKKHNAQELVFCMTDIIGVRIECRFLQDEKTVYDFLKAILNFRSAEGGYHSENDDSLFLMLDFPQPEVMKNGHQIYRIDGYYILDDKKYNFELQIKSLVNSFWSEIEHKIVYKNKRFMMIDGFVTELMNSINDNLQNIDKQLHMLFKRCLDNSQSSQDTNIHNMLVTMINELYSNLVERQLKISVNIKPYSESLVKYILMFSSFKEETNVPSVGYNGTVMNVIDWLRKVDFKAIPLGKEIVFAKKFQFNNAVQAAIGERLLQCINSDFYCNTFFHILFSLEVGNDAQDFMSYVTYYEHRIAQNKSQEALARIVQEVQHADAEKMLLESEIVRLSAMI